MANEAGDVTPMTVDLTWLPERHLAVAATLAHADDLIKAVCDVISDYAEAPDSPLVLANVRDGDLAKTVVTSVRPVPRSVALYTADALTTLRAAIEHTLFAEVEHRTGRPLSDAESRAVEMPALSSPEAFATWVKDRTRRAAPAMHEGAPLLARVRALQPYQRHKSPEEHPLTLLVEHTNLAKHRMPALAAMRLVHVSAVEPVPGLRTAASSREPIRVGDVVASVPLGLRVPISVFPTIGLQRPHTKTWPVAVQELDDIARWARTIAIPILITGSPNVPHLPANFDLDARGDERAAIAHGTAVTAVNRLDRHNKAVLGRQHLRETLVLHSALPSEAAISAWVDELSEDDVVERVDRIPFVRTPADARTLATVLDALVAEVAVSRLPPEIGTVDAG